MSQPAEHEIAIKNASRELTDADLWWRWFYQCPWCFTLLRFCVTTEIFLR